MRVRRQIRDARSRYFFTPAVRYHQVMSPEMETLDQLQGGDLFLTTVRSLYPSEAAFLKGTKSLLVSGDLRLFGANGIEVPRWEWRNVFSDSGDIKIRITEQGIRRIG